VRVAAPEAFFCTSAARVLGPTHIAAWCDGPGTQGTRPVTCRKAPQVVSSVSTRPRCTIDAVAQHLPHFTPPSARRGWCSTEQTMKRQATGSRRSAGVLLPDPPLARRTVLGGGFHRPGMVHAVGVPQLVEPRSVRVPAPHGQPARRAHDPRSWRKAGWGHCVCAHVHARPASRGVCILCCGTARWSSLRPVHPRKR
jgi:hypothetical protein